MKQSQSLSCRSKLRVEDFRLTDPVGMWISKIVNSVKKHSKTLTLTNNQGWRNLNKVQSIVFNSQQICGKKSF